MNANASEFIPGSSRQSPDLAPAEEGTGGDSSQSIEYVGVMFERIETPADEMKSERSQQPQVRAQQYPAGSYRGRGSRGGRGSSSRGRRGGRQGSFGGSQFGKKASAYAIDCEMIEVYMPDGNLQRAVVSIGVVDVSMEVILYARVRKPANSVVVNDTFVKTAGGLSADYDKGLSIFSARELIQRLVQEGAIMVGWQIDNDLKALGMDKVVPAQQIVDLTTKFMTANGHKCKLIEAYRTVFRRNFAAHNAGDDAKVTMELYHYWNEAAKGKIVKIDLNFYCITWHYFKLSSTGLSRGDVLWQFLRPRTNDREVVLEEDDGKNAYKLKFRQKADRDAYMLLIKRRLEENNIHPQGKPQRVAGGRGTEMNFGFFRSHLYEIVR
mmetsp:Transcript_39741/g.66572  ORF Transcript_39741/g.66572 Transcript_39741/m.66572 type:complete len:381 (-) Transcript_39741:194-1336(-)